MGANAVVVHEFPQGQTVFLADLVLLDALRDVRPDLPDVAARVGHAVRPAREHSLVVVAEGTARVVPRLAADDELELVAQDAQKLHLPAAAVGARHRMGWIPARLPRRGDGSVDEPRVVWLRLQLLGDIPPLVGRCNAVAHHRAVGPLAVLCF